MNIEGIKRPEDLPFEVPDALKTAINDLLKAMEEDDVLMLDGYQDEVYGTARMVNEADERWVDWYYLGGGYRADLVD